MRPIVWQWLAATSALAAALAPAATRPRYGGTLRVEIQAAPETLSPSDERLGPLVSDRLIRLDENHRPAGAVGTSGPFRLTHWEPGRRALFEANEDHWAGRPFLDAIDIQMGRPLRDQLVDLELGKADVVEIAPDESRRAAQRGVRVWSSPPATLLALVVSLDDARLREALAFSIDRAAIHNVLLQRQGEPAGGLLPNWISGYAWLFSTAPDLDRARRAAAGLRPASLVLAYEPADPVARAVAERLVVNAREAGLVLRAVAGAAHAEVRLVRRRLPIVPPARALAELAAAFGLRIAEPVADEETYQYERSLVDEYRVVPLVHLPDLYGLSGRVQNWNGYRWDNVWLERDRP